MKNLHIPTPCSENWDLMSPQEKGRFCSVCNKCVIDFTQKNNLEIEQIMEEKKDVNVCGRFYNHQLNIEDSGSLKLKDKFFNYLPSGLQNNRLALTLLSLILFLAGCSKPKETCATTGVVAVDLEYDTIKNKDFIMGEPLIQNDSVAKMPEKDNSHLKQKHRK
ncbi:hypothetical protein [Chryseobacterium tongliaoense]|uniref:hypothetical protein n=1 Tax=Chryseobacterium tongliaoense TaxID=3240933 RepID=UPI00351237B6